MTAVLALSRVSLLLCAAGLAGCAAHKSASTPPADTADSASCALDPIPNVVTDDIAAGIESHIDEQVERGGGFFHLDHGPQTLKLRLVRVHMEYLSNLGPKEHFACVDLVDEAGDVYDVDFFLAGDPGAMRVTETSVHKRNGQPYYSWEQASDRTWRRVPVDEASHRHLGVVYGQDSFEFIYRVTLPLIDEPARMWLPVPSSDRYQTVEVASLLLPREGRVLDEDTHGNKVLFLELGPSESRQTLEMRFRVTRLEKAAYPGEPGEDLTRFLLPEKMVPASDNFTEIAHEVLEGKRGELVRARALYDHVIDQVRYMKHGSGWGVGDAIYACDLKTGNCSDFHSYFIALARAAGIPARFAVGASIPSERDDGGIDGYHCWAEFYAEGKWWPIDISEGDKYSSLATYYFGHHPANRVELSRGRDLEVVPGPASGPINFLAYPVLEIGGRSARPTLQLAFERVAPGPRVTSTWTER